jgi:HAD superfamily hydrolase (TIGR01509 family)
MIGLKAVAWDIDGTLVDSEPVHLAALIDVSRRYGVDLSQDPADRFVGQHLGDVWKALSPNYPKTLEQAAWQSEIQDTYLARRSEVAIISDMLEAMHSLHARGIPQACVSNSERRIVDANIAVLDIADLIAFSISREDVTRGKPDPEPYAEACRRFGLQPHEVLAVEDSSTGADSAMAAGLPVVCVNPQLAHDIAAHILLTFERNGQPA